LAPSTLRKHSVLLSGHRTSVSVEDAFWTELKAIAGARGISLNDLIARIDQGRGGNLSGAIRVFVLESLKAAIQDPFRKTGPE
jgi:predicted DNA-binding ribbon-helix-helix protein